MNLLAPEVENYLIERVAERVAEKLKPVVSDIIREQIQPQGYIKAETVRKKILDNIAPQTLEEFKALGLKSYKMTSPRMTFYKKADIDKFMMQFEQKQ
ncbi:hypothetical protein U1295_10680 [Enterococcus cecorum]|uniref:hypothetical protein n=1 Tax=Enterococcus cecorum TaxID=44008 RepID=UPI001FAD13DF|nr:hypothetical protein [Enterococcus cecorum]MCJ0522197.1 hypothetical protein [Enterococcus cecorum]MCJ0559910.1 hypothetical protein [Enterococcus cecorum]MDZ5576452.1 hypothetical protein [Enterococcus cecorum]